MAAEIIRDTLRMTNAKNKAQLQVFIEEDILVPDVKPDMIRVVSVNGIANTGEKENFGGSLRINGTLDLNILYMPVGTDGEFPLEIMNTVIQYRHDEEMAAEEFDFEIMAEVAHIEHSIVNERKLKIKAVIALNVRGYEYIERNKFLGVQNEPMEVLEEKLSYTDICERKKDYIEIREEVSLPEGAPEIGKIVKYCYRVGETYRQITQDKAIISGTLFYDILYLSDEFEQVPIKHQGKIDFTQFIRLEDGEEITGSNIEMWVENIKVSCMRDEEDNMTIFDISAGICTQLETYRNKSTSIVKDAYHSKKVAELEREDLEYMKYSGMGSTELTVRETVNIPPGADGISDVLFFSASAFVAGGETEANKAIIEGILETEIIYSYGSENIGIRSFSEEVPFRCMAEVPDITSDGDIHTIFFVKNISAEKISDRQVEVFAEISVRITATRSEKATFVKSVEVYDDIQVKDENEARLVLYVPREGDNLWSIGKRYKTPVEEIKAINGIAEEELVPGKKLIVWC